MNKTIIFTDIQRQFVTSINDKIKQIQKTIEPEQEKLIMLLSLLADFESFPIKPTTKIELADDGKSVTFINPDES